MRIRYIISTMVFWGRQHRLSFEQECELLKTLGYGVELWPNTGGLEECLYDRRNWPRLASATEGMLVSMRSRNDNPSTEQWIEQIECAKLLKANIVADLQSLRMKGRNTDNGDFAEETITMAENEGVQLCLETGSLDILREIGSKYDSVKYCLDTGFANCDPEHRFKQYVDVLAERTTHLHLAENCGHCDDHMPLGCSGGVKRGDWAYLLNTLNKYDNNVIGSLEMNPCTPVEMIRRSSSFLFDELKWPNRPKRMRE